MSRPKKITFTGTEFAGPGDWNGTSNTSIVYVSNTATSWTPVAVVSDPSGGIFATDLNSDIIPGLRRGLSKDTVTISTPAQGTMNNTAYQQLITDISNANTEIATFRPQYFGRGTRLPGGSSWRVVGGYDPESIGSFRSFAFQPNSTTAAITDGDDGVWLFIQLPVSAPWSCAAIGDSYIMLVAGTSTTSSNVALISIDRGVSWNQVTMPSSRHWGAITYHSSPNGDRFVIVPGTNSTAGVIWRVDGDLATGMSTTTLPTQSNWTAITSDGRNLVAVKQDGLRSALSTNDGQTWTNQDMVDQTTWRYLHTGWRTSTHNFTYTPPSVRTYSNVTGTFQTNETWNAVGVIREFDVNPNYYGTSITSIPYWPVTSTINLQERLKSTNILTADWNGTGVPAMTSASRRAQIFTTNRAGSKIKLWRVPGASNPNYRSFKTRIRLDRIYISSNSIDYGWLEFTISANEGSKTDPTKTNWYIDGPVLVYNRSGQNITNTYSEFAITNVELRTSEVGGVYVGKSDPTGAVQVYLTTPPGYATVSNLWATGDLSAGVINELIRFNDRYYVDDFDRDIIWKHCYPGDQLVANAADLDAAGVTAFDNTTLEYRVSLLQHNYKNTLVNSTNTWSTDFASKYQEQSTGVNGPTDRPGYTRVKYLAPAVTVPTGYLAWGNDGSGLESRYRIFTVGNGAGLHPGFEYEISETMAGRTLPGTVDPYIRVTAVTTPAGVLTQTQKTDAIPSGVFFNYPALGITVGANNTPSFSNPFNSWNSRGFIAGQEFTIPVTRFGYQSDITVRVDSVDSFYQITGATIISGNLTADNSSGATFTVTRNNNTYTSVTLSAGGTNYAVNDIRVIPGTSLDGTNADNSIRIQVTGVNQSGAITSFSLFNSWYPSAPRLPTANARFNVTANNTTYTTVTIANGGTNFSVNDVLTIAGSQMGGSDANNSVTVTVNAIGTSGQITAITPTFSQPAVAPQVLTGTLTRTHDFSDGTASITASTITSTTRGLALNSTITITGTQIGGVTPSNDLTMYISSLDSTGAVNGITYASGAVPLAAIIAVNQSGDYINRSIDGGVSWTRVSLPTSRTWGAFGGGRLRMVLAATGPSNYLLTSTDGLTWSVNTLVQSGNWNSVAYNGDRFILCDGSRYPLVRNFSTDPSTWRRWQDEFVGDWNSTSMTTLIKGSTGYVGFGSGTLKLLPSLLEADTSNILSTFKLPPGSDSFLTQSLLTATSRQRSLIWIGNSNAMTGAVDSWGVYPLVPDVTVTAGVYAGNKFYLAAGVYLYSIPDPISSSDYELVLEATFPAAITNLAQAGNLLYITTSAKTYTAVI